MRLAATLSLAALGTPVLLAFSGPRDTISFHPDNGASVSKVFSTSIELDLEEMNMLMNGQSPPMDMSSVEMTISTEQSVEVVDTYGTISEGKPRKLSRSYDALTSNSSFVTDMSALGMPAVEQDIKGESELEGQTVEFSWNPEKNDFVAAWPDGIEGDTELLEGLTEEMDLRTLLPEGSVSKGDSWDVDLSALGPLLAPGGNLKIVPVETEGDDASAMGGMSGMSGLGNVNDLVDELDGTATAKYTGTSEVDGQRVAVIEFEIEVTSSQDLTDIVSAEMENADLPEEAGPMEMTVDFVDLEFAFKGKGTLHWAIEDGILDSFELTGRSAVVMDMGMQMSMAGTTMELEQSMELAGDYKLNVEAELQ